MNFNEYQKDARKLDIYPTDISVICHAFGLGSEAGEVLGKIKKQIRDKGRDFETSEFKEAMKKELGDVQWYLANLATDLDLTLEEIAEANIDKLQDRQRRGKLQGSGDNR